LIEVKIISVGKRAPAWIQDGCAEYLKRLGNELKLVLHEIQTPKRGRNDSILPILEKESVLIADAVPAGYYIIALDEKGRSISTRDISGRLNDWQTNAMNVCFIIGGPDGLHSSVKDRANEIWSLSSLTLPHMVVRVVLLEQVYRAWCILKGHPYHRD
jgi:23S rRNA (pseudouridine1915-N3)-methyltransferase